MNDCSDEKENKVVDRRDFLKSIFGVGVVSNPPKADAAPGSNCSFFWCNLKTGQIGFPTGLDIPYGLPGSVMKLVGAAALKEEHLVNLNEKLECRGKLVINNNTYSCLYPHGLVDLVHAVGLSCNIYFAQVSERIKAGTLFEYARRFGLDKPVTDLETFKFPQLELCKTGRSDQCILGLADDFKPSALQLMRLAALTATEDNCPHLHSADQNKEEAIKFETNLSQSTWLLLKQGMHMAARMGTGKNLDPADKMHLAVKTGTAPHGKKFQSWIIGYFPYDAPCYAFCLRSQEGTSQDAAVPKAHHWLFSQTWP